MSSFTASCCRVCVTASVVLLFQLPTGSRRCAVGVRGDRQTAGVCERAGAARDVVGVSDRAAVLHGLGDPVGAVVGEADGPGAALRGDHAAGEIVRERVVYGARIGPSEQEVKIVV